MKLISATIKNFRLLKNLRLDFSTSDEKPLTVIRAANESGKTTAETALIWGLYGSEALPGGKNDYPLCPSDAISLGQKKLEISVEIEFEAEQIVFLSKTRQELRNCGFRLKRSCIEYPTRDGSTKREGEKLFLYEVTPEGVTEVPKIKVESIIESSIPSALKDVYFTDGDRAMTFIEAAATQGVKRRRVRKAIEALLGLNILENTISHLNSAARSFSSQIDDTDYKKALERLNDHIASYEEDIGEWSDELLALEANVTGHEQDAKSTQRKIEDLLKLGDKEKLSREVKRIKQLIKENQEAAEQSLKDLSSLVRSPYLANSAVRDAASKGLAILNDLSEKKQLPKVSIPILEELLERKDCFCGEDLDESIPAGQQRREHIKSTIENSRSADEQQEAATALFYGVRSEPFDNSASSKWLELYSSFSSSFSSRRSGEIKFKDELKEKEGEIDQIKDTNLEILREHARVLRRNLDNSRIRIGELNGLIEDAKSRKSGAEMERSQLERKASKTDTSADKMNYSRLCETLFTKVYDRLRNEELRKVSSEMNRIFLEMIGADPEANDLTLITKAELTEDFDILVYGPKGHRLNPDQDLNGASRRALTLAFILALTKVSKVNAPNVIDTPLGMMAGFVKNSVLNKTLEEGTQIVLFLTHDEINGVEKTLDQKAGKVYTLTNPAHYPKMLVNKPDVSDARIIRCECNHRQQCPVCERISA